MPGIAALLLRHRNTPGLRHVVREVGFLYGWDVPREVEIGSNFTLAHRGMCTVIHPRTTIGNDVTIYHGVTLGRAFVDGPMRQMGRIFIGDKVTIAAGAAVLVGETDLHIGAGSIIGANSVVTKSVPAGEVWAGSPARRLRGALPRLADA